LDLPALHWVISKEVPEIGANTAEEAVVTLLGRRGTLVGARRLRWCRQSSYRVPAHRV